MRPRDTSHVLACLTAVTADALAVFSGFMLATWLRFDSGLIPLLHEQAPPHRYGMYSRGAAIATLLFLLIFQQLRLYSRPQVGVFFDKVPRIVRGIVIGLLLSAALAFALRTDPPFSRITVIVAAFTITALVWIERAALFRLEITLARRAGGKADVLILGTESIAARLGMALEQDPRLRFQILGFLRADPDETPTAEIPQDRILGCGDQLEAFLANRPVDQLIVTGSRIPHQRLVEIILTCERRMITFSLVPDIFHVMTGSMDMLVIDGIPMLGIGDWPLDRFWNRCLKRTEDLLGSVLGLLILAPLMGSAALVIRLTSSGPVLFRQERCGHNGKPFSMIKLRTMRSDAESDTGPVWAVADDPRRTRFGAWLRRWNIDELPQLWNVLRGDMSLVGPRPERPFFVDQFREDIGGYMWRHVSRPGMTGWAQVNGLRGNTSIGDRVRYDLYYLENWSLAFDAKILLRTLFSRQNAY